MESIGRWAVVMAVVFGVAGPGFGKGKTKAGNTGTAKVHKGKGPERQASKAEKKHQCTQWVANEWQGGNPLMRLRGPYKDALRACKVYLKASDHENDGKCKVARSFPVKPKGVFRMVVLVTISRDSMAETVENLAVDTAKGWFFAPAVHSSVSHDRLYSDEIHVKGVKAAGPVRGVKGLLEVDLHREGFNTPGDADRDENGDPLQQDRFEEDLRILCTLGRHGAAWCTPPFPVAWVFTHNDYSKGGEAGLSRRTEGAFSIRFTKGAAMVIRPAGKAKISGKFKGFEGHHSLVPPECRVRDLR